MEDDRASRQAPASRDAAGQGELPPEARRVAPAASPGSSSSFANVQLRPEGQRYGDADLVPGGSLEGNGGVLMNERNFRGPGMSMPGDGAYGMPGRGGDRGFGSADGYARFDPMFPGQAPPGGGFGRGFGGGGRFPGQAPRMPGEPDDDIFLPPHGRPGEPFGGPGGGQFGPRQSGGWGLGGGGGSPWA